MNGRWIIRPALPLLLSAALGILTACTGVGIFAYIAVSDQISEGLLPKGTGASKIVQIADEYPATHYDYFSSGPTLFRRNTSDRSSQLTDNTKWKPVGLPSGWTNIQSMAASDSALLLALAKESGGILTVGLFFYNDSSGFKQVQNTTFKATESEYKTVLVYSPNPKEAFYVNVLSFSGDFGQDSSFKGSQMYRLPDGDWDWSNQNAEVAWTGALTGSYVSGAAWSGSGGSYRFTTVNPAAKTGALVDENGATRDGSITLPCTGLTWLENVTVGTGTGAFIMSSMVPSDGSYKVYVNTDNRAGADGRWIPKSSGYRFDCFLDITATQGGGVHADATKLVLAGTRSVGNDPTGNGYMEIDVSDTNPKNWIIRTNRNSFTFAGRTNYESGKLVESSVVGLSLFKDGTDSYVYASTDGNGILRINADDYAGKESRPNWVAE